MSYPFCHYLSIHARYKFIPINTRYYWYEINSEQFYLNWTLGSRNTIFAGTREAGATYNFVQFLYMFARLLGGFSAAIRPTKTYILPRFQLTEQRSTCGNSTAWCLKQTTETKRRPFFVTQISDVKGLYCTISKSSTPKRQKQWQQQQQQQQQTNKQTNKSSPPPLLRGEVTKHLLFLFRETHFCNEVSDFGRWMYSYISQPYFVTEDYVKYTADLACQTQQNNSERN